METVFVAMFAFVIGLVLLLWGYRAFLVLLPIWGFFAGFWFGAEATSHMLGEGFLATTTGWVVGVVVGLIGAVLSYMVYLVGVALVSAGFGIALGTGLMSVLGFERGFLALSVGVVLGVVIAALTLRHDLQRFVVTAITAIGGASAVLASVLLIFGRITLEDLRATGSAIAPVLNDSWFWMAAWLIIAIIGGARQVRADRDFAFSKDRYAEGWG